MKNYVEVKKGVYQSRHTVPNRVVDENRIREIIKDKSQVPVTQPKEERKTALPLACSSPDRA